MERITFQEVPKVILEGLRAIEDLIDKSPLDRKLTKLIKLRASQKNGCAYCVDMHHKELKHLGETDLRLSSLCVWEETPYFSEKERATLHFTDALTQLDGSPIYNRIYDPLLNFYSKEEICYLTLVISLINSWNRMMKTFGIIPGNYKVNQ